MHPARIFISYRRDDSAGYARAIGDALGRAFGSEQVFIDVDDIGAGLAYAEVIAQAVGGSRVLLVLIGKRWQGPRDGQPPRIMDADDLVRREVASALERGMRVIPVLLDGAPLPSAADLPDDLRPLLQRNAVEVDNARFASDVERLTRVLREFAGAPSPPKAGEAGETVAAPVAAVAGGGLRWALIGGVVALLVALGLWATRPAPWNRSQPSQATAAATRAAINGVWQAEVDYDWPGAHFVERYEFSGDGNELSGSASFLGAPRGVLEGRVDGEGLRFITHSSEAGDAAAAVVVHRYHGRLDGGAIRFTMQTEGSSSPHVPVEFVARRLQPSAPSATSPTAR